MLPVNWLIVTETKILGDWKNNRRYFCGINARMHFSLNGRRFPAIEHH
jgi:hypothetical protein